MIPRKRSDNNIRRWNGLEEFIIAANVFNEDSLFSDLSQRSLNLEAAPCSNNRVTFSEESVHKKYNALLTSDTQSKSGLWSNSETININWNL